MAVEGGWKYSCVSKPWSRHGDGMTCTFAGSNDDWSVWNRDDNGSSICPSHTETLWDPSFWQALGKALGWRIVGPTKKDNDHNPEWYYRALEFYELILTGGDTEKFWEELYPSTTTV